MNYKSPSCHHTKLSPYIPSCHLIYQEETGELVTITSSQTYHMEWHRKSVFISYSGNLYLFHVLVYHIIKVETRISLWVNWKMFYFNTSHWCLLKQTERKIFTWNFESLSTTRWYFEVVSTDPSYCSRLLNMKHILVKDIIHDCDTFCCKYVCFHIFCINPNVIIMIQYCLFVFLIFVLVLCSLWTAFVY